MLTQTQHAVESNPRIVARAFIDGNAVYNVAFAEVFERPEEMLRGDTKHGGADANAGIERDHFVVLQFLAEAVDEVDFRADSPFRANGRNFDCFDDAFGRADCISGLGDLETALGMGNDANAGMLAADALDLLRGETLMHGTVALPENDPRPANLFRRIAAKLLVGIPNNHLLERDAHAIGGVAAEMLIGEEKNFFAAFKSPLHDRGSVRAGANRPAVLTGEGFDGRGGVHVCHGRDVQIAQRREFAPASLDLADVGHIGHRTAGVEVGQDDSLMLAAKNVCALGHEVDATKDDIAALGLGSLEGEFEGVTEEIGELDDFVALVVMPQNDNILAEAGFGGGDAVVEGVVRHEKLGIEVAAYARLHFRA